MRYIEDIRLVLLLTFVALAACSTFAADAPARDNVALGKRYVMTPRPGYRDTVDADDKTQLTDGKYSQGRFWVQKTTVGWVYDATVEITIDLEGDTPISGVTFNTAAGSGNVHMPKSMRLLVSIDGHVYHDLGDLVELDRKGPAPSYGAGYAVHKFVADALQAHGRYVRLIIEAEGPFVVVDEIEVWRGDDAWVNRPLPGKGVWYPMAYDSGDPLTDAVMRRTATDLGAAINLVNDTPLDDAVRQRLLAEAARIEAAIGGLPRVDPEGFRSIFPLNNLHARAYGICGAVRAAQGRSPLVVWSANPWDFLKPLELPDNPPPPTIEVAAMHGETRAAVINMANNTAEPMTLTATFTGLTGGATPDYIKVHDVVWTDTRQGVPVAAALPEVSPASQGFSFVLPAGMTRQLWLSVTPRELVAGTHRGELILSAQGLDAVRVPLQLRVFDVDFPDRPTLHFGGWDETDGDEPRYAVNDANRELVIEHLRQRFVDSPWGTPEVMPFGKYADDGTMIEPPDTSRFDTWIKRWPDARQYCVFNNVGDSIAGTKLDDPLFDVKVQQWIRYWVAFLRERGIGPDKLTLLLVDEPRNLEHDQIVIAWARAIRAVEPKVVLWENPVNRDPTQVTDELFASADVLCPNRVKLLKGGQPIIDFYLDQKAQGRRLELYSCLGPARLLDPYSYHRLQAWSCFDLGAEGTYFWAFGDTGGAPHSWNEYFGNWMSFTPLFIGPDSVTAGRHMEAIRESVQDHEYMVMLRDRLASLAESNPSHPRLAEAKSLLAAAPRRVLDAEGADKFQWRDDKDRRIADEVRIEVGAMLEALKPGNGE